MPIWVFIWFLLLRSLSPLSKHKTWNEWSQNEWMKGKWAEHNDNTKKNNSIEKSSSPLVRTYFSTWNLLDISIIIVRPFKMPLFPLNACWTGFLRNGQLFILEIEREQENMQLLILISIWRLNNWVHLFLVSTNLCECACVHVRVCKHGKRITRKSLQKIHLKINWFCSFRRRPNGAKSSS